MMLYSARQLRGSIALLFHVLYLQYFVLAMLMSVGMKERYMSFLQREMQMILINKWILLYTRVQYVALRKHQKRPGSKFFNELG